MIGRVCQPGWSTSIFLCTRIPVWKQQLNFSPLMMRVPPSGALREQSKAGTSVKTRKGTRCAALGSEPALLHIGGSTVSHQKRKSILSAQHPSSQDPIVLVKTGLLFPGCLLLSPALLVKGDDFPSLQSQHKALQGFQPGKRWGGESCRCHGNDACKEQSCPSGATLISEPGHIAGTCISKAFP